MYKINISWYYCQSDSGRLRLSRTTKQIKICGTPGPNNSATNLVNSELTSVERRLSPRLTAYCDAEVLADLSILDSETVGSTPSLVFMGQTKDLSKFGIGLILPSLLIDERFCNDSNRLELSLYLPDGRVTMVVSPVRCSALDETDGGRGYLVGARIHQVIDHRDEFEQYLQNLATI